MESIVLGVLALACIAFAVVYLRDRRPLGGAMLLLIALMLGSWAYWSAQRFDDSGDFESGDPKPTIPVLIDTP